MEHQCNESISISVKIHKPNGQWLIEFGGFSSAIIFCPYCGNRLPMKRASRKGINLRRFTLDEDCMIIEGMTNAEVNKVSPVEVLNDLSHDLDRSYESVKFRWYRVLKPEIKSYDEYE